MLKHGCALWLLVTLLCAARVLADNADDDDLHRPRRLTVGVADDLLGQLSRDGKTLYFVSNRDTTHQLLAQELRTGRVWELFDDGADVTWPRMSPDGRALLYVSFRDSAAGQLCVRSLPGGEDRRCLEDAAAALQAEWIDDRHIALISRESVSADLRLRRVTLSDELSAEPILTRNMTSPALTPDGRYLVYVPVSRTVQAVGPGFAAHAALTLEALSLAQPSAAPQAFSIPLPGQTGQPVFARDGRYLYFVQFFTDTNHDGAVDASDRGVLFRAPIAFDNGAPTLGNPEQLTETSWNCQYPAPAAERLIMTCSRGANLDVYALPLAGEVPESWSMEQLANAIEDADTLVVEQLLRSRRLARETTLAGKRQALLGLALVHLAREEFRAAEYYARQTEGTRDGATAGIALPLDSLVQQRRSERRREQGRLLEAFRGEALGRLEQLRAAPAPSALAEDLNHLAQSEILDSLGDETQARAELEAVTFDAVAPAPLIEAYYLEADRFYRLLDDRAALWQLGKRLARHPALHPDGQLRYARAAVRALVRGLPLTAAQAQIARERASLGEDEAELGFALELAAQVLAIRDAHTPQAVGQALVALYDAQPRHGRRRALIVDAVERADQVDDDDLLDALVQRDIQQVLPGTHERGEAEDVYERLILARAYERVASGRHREARADFDAVARHTGSFEAVVGAIDMRLALREAPAAIVAEYDKPHHPRCRARFAFAYLTARRLPYLHGEEHTRAAAAAVAALEASWAELEVEKLAHALYGALLHEQYLHDGKLDTAERANAHYLVALELVTDNPRFRALILGQLGTLHVDVGNYRIALGYLLERDKLPYDDNAEGLDAILSRAQALLHAGRVASAADSGDAALAMVERKPALARHRILVLDLAALCNLAAERVERALSLYDQELALLGAARRPSLDKTRFMLHVARAAAALGARLPERALTDLDGVDAQLREPGFTQALVWPHATVEQVARSYRAMSAGMRASANRSLARWDAEEAALRARRDLLAQRLDETAREETAREQLLVDAQLARNAGRRRDAGAARAWIASAFTLADDLQARAHGVSARAQLSVLWLAAELSAALRQPVASDLHTRLERALAELRTRHEPWLRAYRAWFEIYAALLHDAPH